MKKSASSRPAGHGKKKKGRIVRYSADNLPEPTKEEWARFDALRDEDIDCSDIPELGEEFWKNARLMPPLIAKKPISIRIDPYVLSWFKGTGKRYQSRINAVLRAYVESQKPHR
jgi:uncharacterized protein (DUF4415 family)